MLALSGPACETCQYRADELRKAKRASERYEGDFDEVLVSAAPTDNKPGRLLVTVHAGSWKIVGRNGAVRMSVKPRTYRSYYDLTRRQGRWIVSEVTGIE